MPYFKESLYIDISIHAPHEGERPKVGSLPIIVPLFQSTLPTRGSDDADEAIYETLVKFQSTLPTRGSDDKALYSPIRPFGISIHAPHEGERQQ